MDERKEITELADEIKAVRQILPALGDENRQNLILQMLQMEECGGARVGSIEPFHIGQYEQQVGIDFACH